MVVLSLVCEEPMHPYRMQTLIKERGKDQIANVAQRNSVYQTITALRRAGLLTIRETSREERRPERTVYEATKEGRRTLTSWMRTVLSTPAREFPDFPAALSLVALLGPDDARTQFEARAAALELQLAELERPVPNLPRLFLLEAEVHGRCCPRRDPVAARRHRRLAFRAAYLEQRMAPQDHESGRRHTPPRKARRHTCSRPPGKHQSDPMTALQSMDFPATCPDTRGDS